MPILGLTGQISRFTDVTQPMLTELACDREQVSVEAVPKTGHWYAEQNPAGTVELLTSWFERVA